MQLAALRLRQACGAACKAVIAGQNAEKYPSRCSLIA